MSRLYFWLNVFSIEKETVLSLKNKDIFKWPQTFESLCHSVYSRFEQVSPVAVVTGRAVRDVCSGHQQESPEKVYDAAEGQDQEGGLDRDVLLIQNLDNRQK